MKILVTGGGGYLGGCLTRHLLEQGHGVRVFDRFCFGRAALDALLNPPALEDRTPASPPPVENAPGKIPLPKGVAETSRPVDVLHRTSLRPALEIVQGDVRRLQEAPDLLHGIDAVIHLAGLANNPSCDLNEQMAWDVNVESTVELARLAMNHGVRRFVFASACSVYGRGVVDILDEQSQPRPLSAFGLTKHAAENALLDMRGEGFEPVIARMATLFGVSPRMRFDLAVNQMVARALQNKVIEVRSNGRQWRAFLHVDDAAEALTAMVTAPASDVAGEIFNTGDSRLNLQVLALAQQVAAQCPDVNVTVPRDDDDLRNYRVRFDKIRERLGFAAKRTIAEGIDEVATYLRDTRADAFADEFFNVRRMEALLATPVDEGGEPVAARFIPLSKPNLGPEEEQAVVRALRSGWLTSGPQIAAFERAFQETVSAPRAIAVTSCTAALHLVSVGGRRETGRRSDYLPHHVGLHGQYALPHAGAPCFRRCRAPQLQPRPRPTRSGNYRKNPRHHARAHGRTPLPAR